MRSNPINDLISKFHQATIADLKYADALAVAHQDTLAHNCWTAWISYLQIEETVLTGPDGKAAPLPEPHVITSIQRAFNLSNALQPTSPMSVACAPLANTVKMRVFDLITAAATGTLLFNIPLP